MLFKKYHIVVFKDKQGSCKKFQLRGWLIAALFFLMVGMGTGNVILWKKYANHSRVEKGLNIAEKTVQDQKTQLLSLSQKISSLQKNLDRIRDFDSKLRVMINLDQDAVKPLHRKVVRQMRTFPKATCHFTDRSF